MEEPLLELSELAVQFQSPLGAPVQALNGVNLTLQTGETAALVGESGSGKTVCGLAIMGLLDRKTSHFGAASRISFRGEDLLRLDESALRRFRGGKAAMIFQDPSSAMNPLLNVEDQIAESLVWHLGLSRGDAKRRVTNLLDEVGFPEPALRKRLYPHQLSGGQKQRAMIAIAIACEPQLLIADEPTTSLDVTVQRQIIDLLRRLQKERALSILFITHDINLAADVSKRIAVMHKGRIVECSPTASLLSSPQHEQTKKLLTDLISLRRAPRGAHPRNGDEAWKAPKAHRRAADVILSVRGLAKSFVVRRGFARPQIVKAVDDVAFELPRGSTVGLVGESGAGKSTVARLVLRLLEPTRGELHFEGTDLRSLSKADLFRVRRRMQIVFQNPYASLYPEHTVEQILIEPLEVHGLLRNRSERGRRAIELLASVGLGDELLQRRPAELSGGQRQRIAIARSLGLDPDVLVCDEIVSALDASTQAQVLELLKSRQRKSGTSYLFVTHDLAAAQLMCDELLVMQCGKVVESGLTEQICFYPQAEYTRQLLDAVPSGISRFQAGGTAVID